MTPFAPPFAPKSSGWIELVCGPMFSGKTEELIRLVKRAAIAKQHVQVFKPLLDDRYVAERVSAHTGATVEALRVADTAALRAALEQGVQVVAIDEVQFFDPAIVSTIQELAGQGKRVIATGLDLDFRGEPFGFMPTLLAMAEAVTKLSAICLRCGAPGTRTQRLIVGEPAAYDEPVILIGADESYEARCRACHVVPSARDQRLFSVRGA